MKDYKKIEETIKEDKLITIKELTELGYSRYDINQYLEKGIISRVQRGIYIFNKKEDILEKQDELPTNQDIPKLEEYTDEEKFIKEGINCLTNNKIEEAITYFNKALETNPNSSKAKFYIFSSLIYKREFNTAVKHLIEYYNIKDDDSFIYNLYYYSRLLSKLTEVDIEFINKIEKELSTKEPKKHNQLYRKFYKSLDNENYVEANKYINFIISIDKKNKKYYITTQILKILIVSILKQLEKEQPKEEEKEEQKLEDNTKNETEQIIIVPEIKIEQTIKQNILLEAINNNEFAKAYALLQSSQIENPYEIISSLLQKLSTIQSLISTKVPLKVTQEEEVTLVDENQIVLSEFQDSENKNVYTPPITEDKNNETIIEKTEETPTSEQKQQAEESKEPTIDELINITYQNYKEAYHTEDFQNAKTNLRRYEYLNNQNGTHRNINYHFIRVDTSEKDFNLNQENYFRKKELTEKIFELRKQKLFEEALIQLEEYKKIPGLKQNLTLIVEAEIYFDMNNLAKAEQILKTLYNCEEPKYFLLKAKICFKQYYFQDAIKNCIEYNERRPNSNPLIYQIMGDCYNKIQKHGKALKAYRKAEELYKLKNKEYSLNGRIARAEIMADEKRELRLQNQTKKK